MISLGWEPVVLAAQTTTTEALAWIQGIRTWKNSLAFETKAKEWASLEERLGRHRLVLDRYQVSLNDFYCSLQALVTQALEHWRGCRDHYSLLQRNVGVPAALAKRCADKVQSVVDPSQPCAITYPAFEPPASDEDMLKLFRSPVFVPYNLDSAAHPFVKALAAYWTANRIAMIAAVEAQLPSTCEKGVNHSHHAIEVSKVGPFPWDKGGSPVVAGAKGLCAMMHLLRNYQHDGRSCVWPWGYQRLSITCAVGNVFVVVLEAELARQAENVDAWLAASHHTVLASAPIYTLSPGDTLVLPMGCRPLFLSYLPGQLKDQAIHVVKYRKTSPRKPCEYSAFYVSIPFDSALDASHSAESQVAALKAYISGLNWTPASMRAHAGVAAWKAKMEAVSLAPQTDSAAEAAP